MQRRSSLLSVTIFMVLTTSSWASGQPEAPANTTPSFEENLAHCQDLKNADVSLTTTFYQGRSSTAITRDLKLGLHCFGKSAETLFWSLAKRNYAAEKVEDLKQYAQLWDTGRSKVSLFYAADDRFIGTQIACYAVLAKQDNSDVIVKPYCWTIMAVNDGVNEKLRPETYLINGTLYEAMTQCLQSAKVVRDFHDSNYFTCEGANADQLLATFRDGKSLTGDRYSLSKDELRTQPVAEGTASALYSKSDKSEKVIFGESTGWFGSETKLSDNSMCEKVLAGRNVGTVTCRFYFGSELDLVPRRF